MLRVSKTTMQEVPSEAASAPAFAGFHPVHHSDAIARNSDIEYREEWCQRHICRLFVDRRWPMIPPQPGIGTNKTGARRSSKTPANTSIDGRTPHARRG